MERQRSLKQEELQWVSNTKLAFKKIDEDLFEKTKSVIEEVKKAEIRLEYSENQDGEFGDKGKYTIRLGVPERRTTDMYVALERSLGHILFDTPYNHFQINSYNIVDDANIPSQYMESMEKALLETFKILEAERVEQNYGSIYRGTKIHFEDELYEKGLGRKKVSDPIAALMAVREGRNELVEGTKFEPAIACVQGVRGTDNRGALLWGKKYFDLVLKDWLQESRNSASQSIAESQKSLQNYGTSAPLQGEFDAEAEIESQIKSSSENGEKVITEIKKKMMDPGELHSNLKLDNVYHYLERIQRDACARVECDTLLASRLQDFFRKVNGMKSETIDDSGLDFDLDEAIQDKFKKTGEIYLEEEDVTGLAVVIAVDLSGSMTGGRERDARNICATLFRSIKGIPKVELQVIGWSSPNGYYGVSVTDIKNEQDLKKLTISSGHMENGNHLAMQYASDVARKMRGSKKLVIFITDGVPNMNVGGKNYSYADLVELSRMATIDANKKGVKTMGVYIDSGCSPQTLKAMNKMFLGRVVNCADMGGVKDKIVKEFARNVSEVIRR